MIELNKKIYKILKCDHNILEDLQEIKKHDDGGITYEAFFCS